MKLPSLLFPAVAAVLAAAQTPEGAPPGPSEEAHDLVVFFVGDPLDDEGHRAYAVAASTIAGGADAPLVFVGRDDAAWAVARTGPGFALVVAPPDVLDAALHRAILLGSTGVDADPFVDIAVGYLTGSTPERMLATWERSEAVRRDGLRSKRWMETFVTSGMDSTIYRGRIHELARVAGFEGNGLAFSGVESDPGVAAFVAERLSDIDGCGVLSVTGNGDPQGVWLFSGRRNLDRSLHWPYEPGRVGEDPDGAMPRVLADQWRARDLSGAVVWSGTCHSAVCERAWVEGDIVSTFGRVAEPVLHPLPRDESMGLAMLDAGAVALLAPIGANHGMATAREQRFAFLTGAPLGEVMKSTYDDIVLANGGMPALGVPDGRPEGMSAWEREPVMAGGGANRILLGDPRLAPFRAVDPPREALRSRWVEEDGPRRLVVEVEWSDGFHAAAWDMFGTRRDADWRVVARVEVDPAEVPIDATVEVVAFRAVHPGTEEAQPYGDARAMVEHHRGRAFLHLVANAPRETTAYEGVRARFELRVAR